MERTELVELVEFLSHPRGDVQAEAVRALAGFVDNAEFLDYARENPRLVVRPLLRIAEGDQPIAAEVLPPLVNLAADDVLVETMVGCAASKRIVAILSPARWNHQFLLLANLTRLRVGAAQAVSVVPKGVEVLADPRSSAEAVDGAANTLVNCLALRTARDSVDIETVAKLLSSSTRRGVAVRVLLQLALDPSQHARLAEEDLMLVPRIGTYLYPEAAKTDPEYAERREALDPLILAGVGLTDDVEVRRSSCELLLRLGGSAVGRAALQSAGIYEVLRAWHKVETNESVGEVLEDCVPLAQYTDAELREYGVMPAEPETTAGPSAEESAELVESAELADAALAADALEADPAGISGELDAVD